MKTVRRVGLYTVAVFAVIVFVVFFILPDTEIPVKETVNETRMEIPQSSSVLPPTPVEDVVVIF